MLCTWIVQDDKGIMIHSQEITYADQLKGLAIIAVVALHIISNLPGEIITQTTVLPYVLAIDQIARFCVPLFVAISGFGLMRKYMIKKFDLLDFIRRRAFRLLPLYLLWVTISLIIFHYSNSWNWMGQNLSLFLKIGLGRGDYHLYFVPMILQLYLLFPVLFFLMKKYPKSTLFFGMGIQVAVIAFYSLAASGYIHPPFRLTDQREYVTSLSWIGYFVLGMFLATRLERRKGEIWQFLVLLFFGAGLVWSTLTGQKALPGTDTITILRFTRFPVLFYATGAVALSLFSVEHWKGKIGKGLHWMGKHSYLLYLAHPLILRILAGAYFQTADLWSLSIATLGVGVALFLSIYFHLE